MAQRLLTRTLPYPVYDSPDLTGLPGDLGPAVGEFIYRLTTPSAFQDQPYYPETNNLADFYHISNPDADFYSDADGLGLSHAFSNLPTIAGQKPLLSKALEVYYAAIPYTATTLTGLKNHYLDSHYSRRWLRLADEYGLLQKVNANLDKYDPNQSFYWIEDHWSLFTARYQLLYNRVRAVSNIIYNGKLSEKKYGNDNISSNATLVFYEGYYDCSY